jgi:hypothetical protein
MRVLHYSHHAPISARAKPDQRQAPYGRATGEEKSDEKQRSKQLKMPQN